MKIPYSKNELLIALTGIDEKKLSKEILEKLKKELDTSVPKNPAEVKLKMAEHHGISVEVLVNSPNYKILAEEYQVYSMHSVIKKIVEMTDLTVKQAWALLALTHDLI